jgi:hypothetical protein
MGKSNRQREQKACESCEDMTQSVLYRVRSSADSPWRMLCKQCQLSVKSESESYDYGGTWKRNKRN